MHTRYADQAQATALLAQLRTVSVSNQASFFSDWKATDSAITDVLDAAAHAPWHPFTPAGWGHWEALLVGRLAGNPPNAANPIRSL